MKPLFQALVISVTLLALIACSDETTEAVSHLMPTLSTVSLEPSGVNCSQGGSKVDTGADLNGDTVLQFTEIENTRYFCNGTKGSGVLISVTPETASSGCLFGGSRVDSGLDRNKDNILQASEIENTQSLCHSNTAPVAKDDRAALFTSNGSVTIDVLANDQDLENSALTVSAVGSVADATVVVNPDQTLTVSTALTGGTLSFDYTMSDGVLTGTASVTVTITEEPVLSKLNVNLETGPSTHDLLASAVCIDCQSVEYTWSYVNDATKNFVSEHADRLSLNHQNAVTGSLITLKARGVNSDGFKGVATTQQYRLEAPVFTASANAALTRFTHPAPVTAATPEGTFERMGATGATVYAFAFLTEEGSVVTWGHSNYGGDSRAVADEINGTYADNVTPNKVVNLYSSGRAIAAVREDGSVVTWGNPVDGGDSSRVASALDGTIDVVEISGTRRGFAALREDGSVVTWGLAGGNSSHVADEINGTHGDNITPNKVVRIFANLGGFAALREDGSVITWGSGGGNSSGVANEINGTHVDNVTPNKVVNIFSSREVGAFAALREDGSLVVWGGSDTTAVANKINGTNEDNVTVNKVLTVSVSGYYAGSAMAALREDGSVVTWGPASLGGDSLAVADQINGTDEDNLTSNKVISISATSNHLGQGAFAALREDGSVVTWGHVNLGGDSSAVADELDAANGSPRVINIYSSAEGGQAFAALREDGSVITWGDPSNGGNSSYVAKQIRGAGIEQNKVVKIFTSAVAFDGGSKGAFAALKEDGSLVTWGNADYGGDSSAVAHRINGTVPVTQVYANGTSFTAIREDNAVISWGDPNRGGDHSAVNLVKAIVPLP